MDHSFWIDRWNEGQIGFHLSEVNPALIRQWPNRGGAGNSPVLVPLCGKSRDLLYLRELGHTVTGIELSDRAVRSFWLENDRTSLCREEGKLKIWESPSITLIEGDPTEEELLRGVPLREVPDIDPIRPEDLHGSTSTSTSTPPSATPAAGATVGPRIVPDLPPEPTTSEVPDNDVVSDIFARLRASTQDEKGREPQAKRPPKVRTTPVTADDELFLRREEAIAVQLAELIRHVKRAMQDDQNVMIERLRGVKGLITDQLEDELQQRSRYSSAAIDSVRAIAQAGVDFAHAVAGGGSGIEHFGDIDECAADLAVTLSVALRKRITADGNDDGAERASTAFREWRGARIERLCGDIARRAFNVGVVAACNGSTVRVLVAPDHPPCDACAGDARVGGISAGSEFPSGQPYPPLHAGCNCAVVPADG